MTQRPSASSIHGPDPVWVLAGASGRVGRMLMRHWSQRPPRGLRIVPQNRTDAGAGLVWSPLDGPQPFVDWARLQGGVAGLILLAGVTPRPGARLYDNGALAGAAIDAARRAGVPRVLVASSSAVYGAGDGRPMSETAQTAPVNDYGRAKLAAEAICAAATDLDVCCLRIGNVAGADALLLNVPDATPDRPLRLDRFADGTGPRRSYIGPASLARILETLALHPDALPAVLNVGVPQPVTMQALAHAAKAPWQWVPAPPTALQHITLDCTRLSRLYGFAPEESDPATMVAQWQKVKDQR